MSSSGPAFKIPGEYFLDGALYSEPFFGREQLSKIQQFAVTDDDVFIVAYPKSGTTWMQEIAYLIDNGVDLQEAGARMLEDRVPHLELRLPVGLPIVDKLSTMKSPRLMKSHLPVEFLRDHVTKQGAKVIVVMRNPKDTLVSYYHFYRFMKPIDFPGNWNQFFELFKAKKLRYGDFFDWNLGWWTLRDETNVKVVRYENLQEDPRSEIRNIAKFLGKSLSATQVDEIAEATCFQSMRENRTTNWEDNPVIRRDRGSFMRKGKVGDWVNYFTPEQSDYVDKLVETVLKPNGILF